MILRSCKVCYCFKQFTAKTAEGEACLVLILLSQVSAAYNLGPAVFAQVLMVVPRFFAKCDQDSCLHGSRCNLWGRQGHGWHKWYKGDKGGFTRWMKVIVHPSDDMTCEATARCDWPTPLCRRQLVLESVFGHRSAGVSGAVEKQLLTATEDASVRIT